MTSESGLIRRFGAANVHREEIALGEGDSAPGTVLFPDDPKRRLEIVWQEEGTRVRPELVRVRGESSLWAVAPGITVGTTIEELEQLNAGPFTVGLFAEEAGGTVASWKGGRLEALSTLSGRVQLWLVLSDSAAYPFSEGSEVGEMQLASDAPLLRRLSPRVGEITLWFERPGGAEGEMEAGSAAEGEIATFDSAQVPGAGARAEDFVPSGWQIASQIEYDLDGDRRSDRVLHLVPADATYGAYAVTAAPEAHALLILLATEGGGLRRAGIASRLLQPIVPQYGLHLGVENGILVVNQNFGMSDVTDLTHRFRYEAATGRFLLIGMDRFLYTRPISRHDTERVSEDYVRGVRLVTTGHVRNGVVERESTVREQIAARRVHFDEVDELP